MHLENDSYIVACQAKDTGLRWLDPDAKRVEKDRGRIHVEEQNKELVLVFTSIALKDNGNWTCKGENEHKKISFNMIVYSKINSNKLNSRDLFNLNFFFTL